MRVINSHLRILETTDYQVMRWKNGRGSTREIAVTNAAGNDFDWRLSIADITADGVFSSFPGYARTIVLLEGSGMVLTCDAVAHTLDRPFEPFDFDGGASSHCRLIAGPARDFNIMSARTRCRHEWTLLREFPFTLDTEPGDNATVALLCCHGELTVRTGNGARTRMTREETLLAQPLITSLSVDAASPRAAAILVVFRPA